MSSSTGGNGVSSSTGGNGVSSSTGGNGVSGRCWWEWGEWQMLVGMG